MPKKYFPHSIENLTVKQDHILTSVKDFGIVYSKISDDDQVEFKDVYMKGLGAEKSIKFDNFIESKFYAITNKNEILVGDLVNANRVPINVKLNAAQPIELAISKIAPSIAAVIDNQGIIEM